MTTSTVLSHWDFERESTHSYTNAFHKYPAMLVPKIVDELIKEYSVPQGIFLDPFCGTGRSLVSAMIGGMRCFGIDVNPLAVLISNVKLFAIDPAYLRRQLAQIMLRFHENAYMSAESVNIPSFVNVSYWFSDRISMEIIRLMEAINYIFQRNCRGKDFFYVALSETIRDVSWTRKSEFKLYRMDKKRMESFAPDTLRLFVSKSNRNIEGMSWFRKATCKQSREFSIISGDARYLTTDVKLQSLLPREVDLIITSPPYGDSRTTVDYGNFSRLSLQWLHMDYLFAKRWNFWNNEEIVGINKKCLGGQNTNPLIKLTSPTLANVLANICCNDVKRAKDVERFFIDLYMCYNEIVKILSESGHVCFVVANRTVKGYQVPMDQIIVEFGHSLGMKHEKSITRRILGKKLPRRINTNSRDVKHADTMLQEHIEIFKKQ